MAPAKDPGPQLKSSTGLAVDVAPLTLAAPGLQKPVVARMTAVTKPLAQSPVSGLLPFVTLAPAADGNQRGSTESPLLLGFMAGGREVDRKASVEDESLARTVDSTETSLMTTATNSLTSFQVKATRTSTNLDITPPTVSLTAPTNNASVSGTVSLTASASDNVKVAGVQFYVDGTPLGAEDTKSPYNASWNTTTVANGTHTLTARARDAAGNITTSTVTVTVDNTKPTVSLAAPAGGVPVSSTVNLAATASDNDRVTQVQFFVDNNTTPLAIDTSPDPTSGYYSVSWDTTTVTNGTHTLKAVAYDAAGNTTTSTVVVPVDNTKPTVSLAAPANGAPVSGAVTLSATASDNVGVTEVRFVVDNNTTPLATDTGSPYNASWDTTTVANGTHTLKAVASDAAGNITTSTVNIIVENEANLPVDGLAATTTQIPLGAWPDFLATKGSQVYVLNAGESTVSIIDTNTNTVIRTSEQLEAGGAMALSPDGERLYVAEYLGTRVFVLDAETLELDGEPINVRTTYGGTLALSPDGSRLYVGSLNREIEYDEYGNAYYGNSTAWVSVVDTETRDVIAEIPVGWSVGNVELSPDGKLLYANAPDRVYVIDAVTNTQITSFTVGGQPADVAFSPDSKRAYITNLHTGELYVVDTVTNTVIARPIIDTIDYRYFPEGYEHEAGFPTDLEVSDDGSRIYIARGDDIVVVEAATNSVVGEIPVATNIPNDGAQSLTITEAGTIYVTLEDTVVAVNIAPAQTQSSFALTGQDSGARTMSMAAAVNSAPTATVSPTTVNQATGAVAGTVNGVDVDGNPLTYSVPVSGSGAPTKGAVSINKDTGAFAYQPSTGARLAAQTTSVPDFDTFTVNVNDGQVTTPVTVTVAVLPAVATLATPGDTVALGSGANPSAVAVYGNRSYVANATARTVEVIDTETNQVIATVPVQTSPSAIAVSPDGKSVWVANSGSRTVQRIDTQSNTVVATVTVGTTPTALAVTGDSVWVANAGSNSVSRISTTSNTVVATTKVGSAPSAIAVSGDKVYVANKSSNSISVISTATNKVTQTKSSVTAPSSLAVSGGKLYVTQQGSLNRVLVLNSSTLAQIGTINLQAIPTSVAITPDGAQAYVTTSNHRVIVINTQTNSVASTTVINSASGTGGHVVAVDSSGTNGMVYITDAAVNSVRVLSLNRGNTAPAATADPTAELTDTTKGVIAGSLNVKDWDGDTVTYTVTSQPASSTITGVSVGRVDVTAAGIYTFTPSLAARDKAAQTSTADTATFTIRATDTFGATRDVPITVPIAPTQPDSPIATTSRPVIVGLHPADVVFSGNNAYVANYASGNLSVIDTRTNSVVGTIPVVGDSLAASTDGSRIYVTKYAGVAVVDTATNEIVNSFDVPVQYQSGVQTGGSRVIDVAVDPDDSSVIYALRQYTSYQGNYGSLSRIDTDTGEVTTISTPYVRDIEATKTAAGTRIYAGQYDASAVKIYDGATLAVAGTVQLTALGSGSYVTNVAVSTDGKRVYALVSPSDGYGRAKSLSVIDTATNSEIATIAIPSGASDVSVSRDGSRVYVAQYDGRTTMVIDAVTNRVSGSFITDQSSGTAQFVAESPNGTLYITDYDLRTVYAVKVGDTTPPTNAAPTWNGLTETIDPTTGVTTGSVNVGDGDGDALKYYVSSPYLSWGSLTLDENTGSYTYTPALTPGPETIMWQESFTVVVTDGHYTTTGTVYVQTFVDPYSLML